MQPQNQRVAAFLTFTLYFFFSFLSLAAESSDSKLLMLLIAEKNPVQDVKFKEVKLLSLIETHKEQTTVQITGEYTGKNRNLFLNGNSVQVGVDGSFVYSLDVKPDKEGIVTVRVKATQPKKITEEATLKVYLDKSHAPVSQGGLAEAKKKEEELERSALSEFSPPSEGMFPRPIENIPPMEEIFPNDPIPPPKETSLPVASERLQLRGRGGLIALLSDLIVAPVIGASLSGPVKNRLGWEARTMVLLARDSTESTAFSIGLGGLLSFRFGERLYLSGGALTEYWTGSDSSFYFLPSGEISFKISEGFRPGLDRVFLTYSYLIAISPVQQYLTLGLTFKI